MSSQKGNIARQRPQKHQNRVAFKNTLHDTSQKTKSINNTRTDNVCDRCKEVIQWKIKYKKYKPLTQPKTCVKCNQKTVRQAYHVICAQCAKAARTCPKCLQTDAPMPDTATEMEQAELKREMDRVLKTLTERKRRSFLRFLAKHKTEDASENPEESHVKQALRKLKALEAQMEADRFSNDESDGESEDEI